MVIIEAEETTITEQEEVRITESIVAGIIGMDSPDRKAEVIAEEMEEAVKAEAGTDSREATTDPERMAVAVISQETTGDPMAADIIIFPRIRTMTMERRYSVLHDRRVRISQRSHRQIKWKPSSVWSGSRRRLRRRSPNGTRRRVPVRSRNRNVRIIETY